MTKKITKNLQGDAKTKFSFIKRLTVLALLLMFGVKGVMGQTNPTAQALPYTQNFGAASFSSLPAGFATWAGIGDRLIAQTDAENSAPSANSNAISSITTTTTTGGVYGYAIAANGRIYIQTSDNLTNGAVQLILAINTGANTSIRVSYDLELINEASARNVGVVLQYRAGTSGAWTTVDGSFSYYSNATANRGDDDASADFDRYSFNVSGLSTSTNYQFRWATTRGQSTGNSCGIGIDNIDIRAYSPTTYTYNGSGNLATTTNWTPNPPDFVTNDQIFKINTSVSTSTVGSFTVSGNGSKIQIGDAASSAVTVTIGSANAITGLIEMNSASSGINTLIINNATLPYFGDIKNGAIRFSMGAAFNIPLSSIYGTLILDGVSTAITNPGDSLDIFDLKVSRDITVQNSATNPNTNRINLLASGSNNQTLTATGTSTFRNFEINTTISKSGTFALANGSNITLVNDLSLNCTGTSNQFSDGGNTITLSGGGDVNVNLDGNPLGYNFTGTLTTTHTFGTKNFRRSNSQTTHAIRAELNNVNINGAGGLVTFQSSSLYIAITFKGNFTVGATAGTIRFGTVSGQNPSFDFYGNYTYNRTTAPIKTTNTTFWFVGSSPQTITSSVTGGEAFDNLYNFNENTTTGLTIASSISINSSRDFVNGGILSLGTQTISGAGGFEMETGSSLITSSVNGVDGNITVSGTKIFSNNNCSYTFNAATVTPLPAAGVIGSIRNLTAGESITLNRAINLTGIVSFTGDNRTLTTGGNLTLVSSASGTASVADLTNAGVNVGNSISGDVAVQRYIASAGRRWRFLSSPVQGKTIANWRSQFAITGPGSLSNAVIGDLNSNGWHQTYNNITNATAATTTSVRSYVEANATGSTNAGLNAGWANVTTATDLTAGLGFRAFVRGPIANVVNQLGAGGNGINQTAVTLSLTGTINSGDVTPPSLTYSTQGWNLIGNPYPCAYNFNAHYDAAVVAEIANIDANVYVFDATSNSYKSYNASSNTSSGLTGGIIPSGSAFFIQATGTPNVTIPVFVFKEKYKTITSTPVSLHKTDVNKDEFGIKYYKDSSESDYLVIKMYDGATLNSEKFDTKKIGNENLNVSAYGEDSIQLTASCIPFVSDQTHIKLNVEATEVGTYKFDFKNMDNFDNRITVSLFDRYTNKTTDVKANTVYTFEMGANSNQWGNNRFEIILNAKNNTDINEVLVNNAILNTVLSVYPNPATDILNISLSNASFKQSLVSIYNISGHLVITSKMNGSDTQLNIDGLSQGIYFVRVSNQNGFNKTVKFVK